MGSGAWSQIIGGALESQQEIDRLTRTLDLVPEPFDDITLALARMREETRKNAEETEKAQKKAAKAQKAALREQLAIAREVTAFQQEEEAFFKRASDANEALAAQTSALNRELLDEEGEIEAAHEDRIKTIQELARASSDAGAVQEAMAAAQAVRSQELADLDAERAQEVLDLGRIEIEVAEDVDAALAEFHANRLERTAQFVLGAVDAFGQIAAAAVVFQGLELARLEELAAARAADIDEQIAERVELEQAIAEGGERLFQLDEAINEERLREQLASLNEEIGATEEATQLQLLEREKLIEELALLDDAASIADLEREAAALDAKIATEQAFLADQAADIAERFKERQTLEIAAATISGAAAAVAALAPPPIGAGPILGFLLAGGIAATTAASIATIKSQQPPQFPVGFPGFSRAGETITVELEPGESVNTRRATEEMGSAEVDRVNQGGTPGGGGALPFQTDRDGLLRALGILMSEEAGRGRELTQTMQKRDGRALPPIGKRPVYMGRK